eukprot:367966_1
MALYSHNLEHTAAGPISLVIGGILLIPATFILADSIKILYLSKTNDNVQDLNNYFRHGTSSAVITYFIAVIFSYILAIYMYANHDAYKTNEPIFFFTAIIFYFTGRWIMLLLFVFRIDFSFRDSILKYSNKILYPMYIMVFLMPGIIVVMSIVSFMPDFERDDGGIRILCAICWMFIELLLSITLIILFLSRLFHLFSQRAKFCFDNMKQTSSNSVSSNKSASNSPSIVTATETVIVSIEKIYMITKYSLLVIISILSSFLSLVLALFVFDRTFFYYIWALIDSSINIICLYLFLNSEIPRKIYSYLCQYGHIVCSKCCIYCLSCKHHLKYSDCEGVIVNL